MGRPAVLQVCVAVSMVTARVARSQLNFAFMPSKSGPEVTNRAVPLIRNPAPMPRKPSTLLLPRVINTLGLCARLASVLNM